ncbi:phosphonate C-P lyase system protein PhnH [Pelagibius marinus]|uniref:phosphonate C-P lyase system protein PhnH n=1 Tax=Pelagibius marinus TaxID=2762760 RepID=UPI0018728ED1|nr:phosphonate C-P lyase system protein PhnH [Pelagibius marinus]
MALATSLNASGGIDTAELRPGLADPVHDSQHIFRGLLTALAHPGRPVTLPGDVAGPEPLDPATTAVALTLLDYDTPLWIDWIADTPPLRAYLKFHCGCPLVERSQDAAFGLVTDPENMPRLALFAQGRDQYPDSSASLLLQVPSLEEGPAVTLKGPGIRETATIRPAGLPDWFWNDWRLNAAQFPLGVDIFFTCGRSVVGLPRSILAEG